ELDEYPNLVVLQTLSKAWGLAGLRLGIAFASTDIIEIYNKVKPPYNINQATQEIALEALEKIDQVNQMIRTLIDQREVLAKTLTSLQMVRKVYPSDANFLLVKMDRAREVYEYLLTEGIVVRDRSRVELCEGCLRITVGTELENIELIRQLQNFQSKKP
ncbi:MAG: aminotransferase class I/II-fold pyridoxal phosphate-dependent enzyme, partial [Chitinophagales bacterium]